eukprot:TRINITY_DN92199_c0_g1_i1.p1 TRINITY_DN92199_c0_g1~~TRINITY_DN92199_c0_g1_i1.p1  ORF type:complete len:352 (-),score=52.97 TRINITY_DN92199_c0_g1_i1:118-1173(-)
MIMAQQPGMAYRPDQQAFARQPDGQAPRTRSLQGTAQQVPSGGFLHYGRTRSDAMENLLAEEGPIGQSIASSVEEEGQDAGEQRPPRVETKTICGIDERPFFPTVLISSMMLGAVCMLNVQRSLVEECTGGSEHFVRFFSVLYFVTLAATIFCGLADPGQISREAYQRVQSGQVVMPKRAQKTWLYKRPIRRFDHYCRWVTNVIGLNNHREFMIMCAGLVSIAVLGSLVDGLLLLWSLSQFRLELLVWLHLGYSVYFAKYATEIFRLHVGFVSRNELAREWKDDEFYVVVDEETGESIPVADLDEEDYNEHFDNNAFQYSSSMNPWDKGLVSNCLGFWCNTRWSPEQMGEF